MKRILLVILLIGFIAGYTGSAAADNLNVSIQAPASVAANSDANFNIVLDSQNETRGFSLLVNIPQTWNVSRWSVTGLDNPDNVSYQQAPKNLCYEGHIAYAWTFENSPAYYENNHIKKDVKTALNLVLKAPCQEADYQIIYDWFTTEPAEFGNLSTDVKVSGAGTGQTDTNFGSRGSSGGGGGGTPELASNVESKELSQQFVSNGEHIKFSFPRNVTCISYLEFDAKKSFGKVTTIIEMLKDKSSLVEDFPAGRLYKNVNIWVGNGGISGSGYIENAGICFKVEKAWLEENGADPTSINLWRYSEKTWNKLETSKTGEDEKYHYFESKTPGFSSFVIVASEGEDTSGGQESSKLETSTSEKLSNQTKPTTGNKASTEKEKTSSPLPGFSSLFVICTLYAGYGLIRRIH